MPPVCTGKEMMLSYMPAGGANYVHADSCQQVLCLYMNIYEGELQHTTLTHHAVLVMSPDRHCVRLTFVQSPLRT